MTTSTPPAAAGINFRQVVSRLEGEQGDLVDAIDNIRSEKLVIADRLMRGECARESLSALSERLSANAQRLADVKLQLELARPALVAQLEAERQRDYQELLDTLEQRFVDTVGIGQAIDLKVAALAELVGQYLRGIDFSELRGAVSDDRRLSDDLDRIGAWLVDGVLATLVVVLRVKCGFPDRLFAGGDPIIGEERRQYANASLEAEVARSSARLLDAARGYKGPVTAPEVDGATLARQLSGRAGGDPVDERLAGLHPATRGNQA